MSRNSSRGSRETLTSDDVGVATVGPDGELVTGSNTWDGVIPEGYEQENTGFPPYWAPEQGGQCFSGVPISRDDRDPDFVRYHVVADRVMHCKKGSARNDSLEEVTVQPGEIFTVSEYMTLPMIELFGLPMMAVATTKTESKSHTGQEYWNWKLFLPTESKKQLHARRAEAAAMFAAEAKKPPQLQKTGT